MRVSFLISAAAFLRLGYAAMERGWQSDPEYAFATVERALSCIDPERDLGILEQLAAMCAEFEEVRPEAVARAIGRFFGERPHRLRIGATEYVVGPDLASLEPLAA